MACSFSSQVNLGKWVLRYLFSALIDEELRRDEIYRSSLISNLDKGRSKCRNPPLSIQLPSSSFGDLTAVPDTPGLTPRAVNGLQSPITPGMTIGAATPAPRPLVGNHTEQPAGETALERQTSQHSLLRMTTRGSSDYFSANPGTSSSPPPPVPPIPAPVEPLKTPQAPGDASVDDRTAQPPPEAEKETNGKEGGSRFGKKFRIPFGVRKLSRPSSVEQSRPPVADDKAEESDGSRSIDSGEFVIEDNFFGVVQKIRQQYLASLQNETSLPANAAITPSLPSETPVLRPPPLTAIIIQEDSPDSGGVADLYWGTVASVGADVDSVEKVAPTWLGDLLLHVSV
jgi:WD repeat-containing protein 48